jgi:hypothetical protein
MTVVGLGSGSATDWVKAHEELSSLARRRAALDWEEGTALLQALRTEAHRHLGFGTFTEYVERLFGYGPRATEDKLRVATALEGLPEMDQHLREGKLTWSAAREVTRVATPQTERAWLSATRGKTVRQIEALVSGRTPGDLPSDPVRSEAKRHVLRFEISAETFATFREAVAHLRRKTDASLDDDALLLAMAREILQGPNDPGRASYQVAVTVCEHCRQGFQSAAGEVVPVEPEVVSMVRCDAQNLPSAHVDARPRASQTIPPAIRRRVLLRDRGRCAVPGCRNSTFVDLHHLELRSEDGAHHDDNLTTLCAAHHRAEHRGQLVIEGTPSTGLRFTHADGSRYGSLESAAASEIAEKAFLGLRNLGLREKEVREVLKRVMQSNDDAASVQQVLRAAIGELTPG